MTDTIGFFQMKQKFSEFEGSEISLNHEMGSI